MQKTKKLIECIIFVYTCALLLITSTSFAGTLIQPPQDFVMGVPVSVPTEKTIESFTKKFPIGMNISPVNYYTAALTFTDAMKSSGRLITYPQGTGDWDSGKIAGIPVDENGYPLQIPFEVDGVKQAVRFMLNNYYMGKYVVLHDGEGTFTVSSASNELVDGRRHITLNGSGSNVWINITSSVNGNHIRNMRIIPIEYLGNEQSMPIFRPDFISGLQPFHAIRFMDFVLTNNSPNTQWADRTLKTSFTQSGQKGAAWEYVIDMANQLNVDAWINIPHQASDDYIKQLATLFKNNLNPGLKLYVEFSNELWNWPFAQAGYVLNNAPGHPNPYVSAGLAAINPNATNHPEKDAYMMARTFKIFNTVWADRREKLVNVAAVQVSWVDTFQRVMTYLFNTDGVGADAISPTGYICGVSEANHNIWNAMDPAAVTPEMVLNECNPSYDTKYQAIRTTADQYGVDVVVYEGGQHLQPYGQQEWGYNQAVYNAQIHPLMYEKYMLNFNAMEQMGVKLFMAYTYIGPRNSKYGSWGHLENLDQLQTPGSLGTTAPKYKALLDINTPR